MTNEEVPMTTGVAQRESFFTLPKGAAAMLRRIAGYEDHDETSECLRCLKDGTGTRGAPKSFGLKLGSVTRSPQCQFVSTAQDPELEVKHADGDLVCMLTKHVDDLKIGGLEPVVNHLVAELEKVFGKLTQHRGTFTNTGIRHVTLSCGSIQCDQDEYLKALCPIVHSELVGAAAETAVSPAVHELYRSLLGALAYALLTQHWLAVYVVSLQRKAAAPLVIHARRLNAVLRAAQKRPAKLKFTAMQCLHEIQVYSDSGFPKNQRKDTALKDAISRASASLDQAPRKSSGICCNQTAVLTGM